MYCFDVFRMVSEWFETIANSFEGFIPIKHASDLSLAGLETALEAIPPEHD